MQNQLSVLDRITRKAHARAMREWQALTDQWTAVGKTFDDLYQQFVDEEFRMLEKALILKPRLDELLNKYNITQPKPEKLSGNYFWITLRPGVEHEHRFAEFKHIVLTKYLTRSCFLSHRYAWEQKGDTPETIGFGYHIHILASCPNYLMKTQLLKDTKSTFKKFCNGDVPEAFIQIEYVKTKEHFFNIRAYMMGYKTDTWKDPACELDKPWREKHGLDDLYGSLDLENP